MNSFTYLMILLRPLLILVFTHTMAFNSVHLLLCLIITSSCHQINDTNVKNERWAPRSSYEMSKDRISFDSKFFSGVLKDSFKNGDIKYKKKYIEGRENGEQIGWHSNGSISYQYLCKLGKKEGEYTEYYPSGKLQIRQWYTDGKLIENKIIDPDGKVLVNSKIKNGRTYGLLGSSTCRSVYYENEFKNENEK